MDISETIAATLTRWMEENPGLDTIKKVSERSGVGFGTVRRTKNGDGNITVKNLQAIAKAFHRPVESLLVPAAYPTDNLVSMIAVREPPAYPPMVAELLELVMDMPPLSQAELLGRAKEMNSRATSRKNHAG